VHGDGDAVSEGAGKQAEIGAGEGHRFGERFAEDEAGEGLAGAHAELFAVCEGGVDAISGLAGEAELAEGEGAGDVLAGAADEGEFEVVDHAGGVHADERDQAAADEVEQERSESVFDEMGAGEEDDGPALAARFVDGVNEGIEFGGAIRRFAEGEFGGIGEGGCEDFAGTVGEIVGANPTNVEDREFSVIFQAAAPVHEPGNAGG
jgi:hypothetical protein